MDALTKHMEARDEQMRQKLVIYKAKVSARVMATHEGFEDSHTMGGGDEVSPNTAMYGKGKVIGVNRISIYSVFLSRPETHPRGMTVNSHPQAFSLKV